MTDSAGDAPPPERMQNQVLRERMRGALRSDSDFTAFCLDHFPAIYRAFGTQQDRVTKENQLLERLSESERTKLDAELTRLEQAEAHADGSAPLLWIKLGARRRLAERWLGVATGLGFLVSSVAWGVYRYGSGPPPRGGTMVIAPVVVAPENARPPLQPAPPTGPAPRLLLETGMHRAPIDHLSVDVHGRYLLTGSRDKTVRLWQIESGQLLSTYYLPFGPGHRGKIFAVALSPEGTTIAAAGSTSSDSDDTFSIHLVDRETGRLSQIPGLPAVIYDLKFSLDGTQIAAVLRNGDLRVYRVRGGVPDGVHRSPTGHTGHATGVDFDRQGRVVTSDLAGTIDLYDAQLAGHRSRRLTEPPYSVRFSPDGQRLAVGYSDVGRVDVLSARDLQPLFRPNLAGIGRHELPTVAWSSDGSELCAAGRWQIHGRMAIRCWTQGGRGPFRDLAAADHPILDLAPLPDERFVFTSADPGWGVLGEGQIRQMQKAHTADFRGGRAAFRVSSDGQRILFPYTAEGQGTAQFGLSPRRLDATAQPDADPTLLPARTESSRLRISGWQEGSQVRLDGVLLPMTQHEVALSLALAPDDAWFVLGTERYLRCVDAKGRQLWASAAPGETQLVNITADGRLVLAAFHDGTIRWYSAADGRELLALFPHADRQRYVLFTPDGFYDAPSKSEELLRWYDTEAQTHPAQVASAERFRRTYNDPGRVLASLQLARRVP